MSFSINEEFYKYQYYCMAVDNGNNSYKVYCIGSTSSEAYVALYKLVTVPENMPILPNGMPIIYDNSKNMIDSILSYFECYWCSKDLYDYINTHDYDRYGYSVSAHDGYLDIEQIRGML